MGKQVRAMNDFLNPYIAGAPVVEPSMFFGRQDVFDWIEQNLSGRFVNHILVIHGQRRVGKTSVIKQIPNHLPSHFIQVFFDLQGRTHTSLDRFQWWLAREICRCVNQARGQSIPIPDHTLFAQDGEYLANVFLPEVLSGLGESILLLTFDEFDTLSEPEIQQSLTRPLIAYLRRMFDLPNLNFIFSIGSSGHKLENMQASYTEFFKTALYRKISFLKQEDCSQLITRPVEGILNYEPAAVERIYAITSGHPYFTQLICHELFSLSQKTGRRSITREDVESVLEDVIERGTVNLKFVWDEASDLEKWVLSSLAHELHTLELDRQAQGIQTRQVCTDKQLASALHNQRVRYSENDLNTALVHLREKDVLTQDNRFVVELLSIWLLKNRPLDRVRDELVQVNPIANRYNEIGDEFRELGQVEKALDSFRQALSTDSSNLRAQVSIANLHLEGGNYTQAVQGYEAALRIDDDDIAARSGLSTALLALGEAAVTEDKPVEAEEYYQRILTDNPDHPEAHQRLAALYARQAEEALATGEAELALQHYVRALEHTPDDNQLTARYTLAKEEHTKRLIEELVKQSQQAQEQQDWKAALDTIQRALQLAPNDPALLIRLAVVQDAPRLAQISSLRAHAHEMEQLERWDEAVNDWETILGLHPEDEEEIRQSLNEARRKQKMAGDYTQAQAAIKERRYSQAIALLQGVIMQDASYKDAAVLLVECVKARPKRKLELPAGWWRWAAAAFVLVVVIVVGATQWPRLSQLIAGIAQQKTPVATQAGIALPSTTQAGMAAPPTMQAAAQNPLATATAAIQQNMTLAQVIEKLTDGRAPDMKDDFSGTTLGEYWNNDDGAKKATPQDGSLRLSNNSPIGKVTLNKMNYILQVDLRFGRLSGDENFVYDLRLTSTSEYLINEYQLMINPSKGQWLLMILTGSHGQFTEVQKGDLGVMETDRWYELGLVVQNETFWIYCDDKLLLSQNNVSLFGVLNNFGLDPSTAGEATLNIDNWRFWDLGVPEWMRNDWFTSATPTVAEDNFEAGQGWLFSPGENEKFENGRAILFTPGGETFFSREDFQGVNIALEVTFSPRAFPDNASLVWFMGKQTTGDTEGMLGFEYFPITGQWQIFKVENQQSKVMVSGWTQITPKENTGYFMVVVNGNRVSAFYGDTFLGSVESDRSGAGTTNFLSVRSNVMLYTQVDILKLIFWDLDTVEWKTSDWITSRPETVLIDSFTGNEGLIFNPAENEKYQDGRGVLFTNGGGTHLYRNDFEGTNIVMEVSFYSVNTPDPASLLFQLGKNDGSWIGFEYYLITGKWRIFKQDNPQGKILEEELASGLTQPTPNENSGTIMVIADSDQVRVFLNTVFIGSAVIDRSGAGTLNTIAVLSNGAPFAQVDIFKIRLWDLGVPEWMSSDWITSRVPKYMADKFAANEGWQFNPPEKEKYQDGRAVLYTTGGETSIYRSNFTATNLAMEVTFMPQDMPEGAYLWWFQKGSGGDLFGFEYSPGTGYWSIFKTENQNFSKIITDQTQPTPEDNLGRIMVVVNNGRVSAFLNDKFLGSVEGSSPETGTENYLSVRGNDTPVAQVDILKIRFWNLDEPDWMNSNWITSRPATYGTDVFKSGDGWHFSPLENEKYQDNLAVLFTVGSETGLIRDELQGINCALYVAFIARDMPDTASLVWFLRKNTTTGDMYSFEYFPASGFWQILKVENQVSSKLISGETDPTPKDQVGDLMVVVEGDRVSAFFADNFLGYVESSLAGAGTWNELVIRSNENILAQVDLIKLVSWNLDQ